MNKYFTTPEFADLLKEFGIEVETPFYHLSDPINLGWNKIAIKCSDETWQSVLTNFQFPFTGMVASKPAYLLQEVLKWLPASIKHKGYNFYFNYDNKGNQVAYFNMGVPCEIYEQCYLPIQRMFAKLLKDGIITKETILSNYKPL